MKQIQKITRAAMCDALTAAGVVLHPCNTSDTAPDDPAIAFYYIPTDELEYLVECYATAPAEDPEAVTLAPADAAQVWTEDGETVATTAEAATVRSIIRRKGGFRERDLLTRPHEIIHGETWNDAHKVVEILATTPDPDGYRPGCAVDIVTRAIVG